MASKGMNPRSAGFWVRVGILVIALLGILSVIGYFRSGDFAEEPGVQTFLNPEGAPVERKARVVIETPAPNPQPSSTP